jgi:hypothetical protein
MYTAYVVFIVLVLVVGLVWLGYQLAEGRLEDDRKKLTDDGDAERGLLHAEWTALEQTRRVNDVFFTARDAMRRAQDEAGFETRRPPRPGGQP